MKPAFSLLALLMAFASGVYAKQHLNDGPPSLFERDGSFNATAKATEEAELDLDLPTLEKRKGCSKHRKQGDVCKGRVLAKMNSRHNCYHKKSGHCCAKNKNGDYGIDVTSSTQSGEDCGYCFSGKCRAE
ncbi:hypothetical protein VTK56DRAFT_3193 [Thermocarpiscus australiensis]